MKKLTTFVISFMGVMAFLAACTAAQPDCDGFCATAQATETHGAEDFGAVAFGIGPPAYPTATPRGSLNDIQYIDFVISPTVTPDEGFIFWNPDEHTLNIKPNVSDVTLQVGLENYRYVTNKTGVTITNGSAVYINGAQGNRPTIALASYDVYTNAQALGLVTQDIGNNQSGYVTTFGDVRGVDTSAWVAGDELWLGPTGTLTTTKPGNGECAVLMGTAANSTVNGTIAVNVDWRCDKFGDIPGGDYADFEADGTLKLYGDATYWDDLRVPAQATRLNPGLTKPDFAAFVGNTQTFLFDPSSDESVNFAVQVPHRWMTETALGPHVHWSPTTADTRAVVWQLECTKSAVNEAFGSTSVITVADSAAGITATHQIAELSDISMTGITTVSSMLICRLYRDADHPADTYPSDAALLEIDFHFISDSLGSRDEYDK